MGSAVAADPLAEIIDTLSAEHRHIASLLEALEAEAAKLKAGKVPDYQLLLDMVDYLSHYPDRYHHPREDLLFNRLLKRDRTFRPRLDRLMREHKALRHYSEQLLRQLEKIQAGGTADRPLLRDRISEYVLGYREHMRFESKEIFPSAKGSLTNGDVRKLARQTRFIDDPLFGIEVKEQYQRLGRVLRPDFVAIGGELAAVEMSAIESAIENISLAVEKVGHWGEKLNPVGLDIWLDRMHFLNKRIRPGYAPSWQARALNICTRTLLKPMMQFGSVESMRAMTGRIDEYRAKSQPDDITTRPACSDGFAGEWVKISGKRPRKILLYFPGGGFVMRTRTQHRTFVARICRAANTRALIVHYRLAPEVPFPGGLEDCITAYHQLVQQGYAPEDITIAGDSAGGGLVLSTLLALRDEGSPMPGRAIVLSPLADLTYSGESRKFNKRRDPMLPTTRASQMHQIYIGEALPSDRFISPVFSDFNGLPPILGQVGSTEILLSDTERAAEQAKIAGVPFFLEVWEEMPHVFPMFAVLPESQLAIERMAKFIIEEELDEFPNRYGRCEYPELVSD